MCEGGGGFQGRAGVVEHMYRTYSSGFVSSIDNPILYLLLNYVLCTLYLSIQIFSIMHTCLHACNVQILILYSWKTSLFVLKIIVMFGLKPICQQTKQLTID